MDPRHSAAVGTYLKDLRKLIKSRMNKEEQEEKSRRSIVLCKMHVIIGGDESEVQDHKKADPHFHQFMSARKTKGDFITKRFLPVKLLDPGPSLGKSEN